MEAAQTSVGRKFVLWLAKYVQLAYSDQYGVPHPACVVYKEYIITITQDAVMEGEKSHGIIGVTADGVRFERDLPGPDKGPMDQDTWTLRGVQDSQDQDMLILDAGDWYNSQSVPLIRPNGTRAVPPGVFICTTHNRVFYADDPRGCWSCHLEVLGGKPLQAA